MSASRATLLTQRIAEGVFSWLTPHERYEIVSFMPRAARAASDWDCLARTALVINRFEESLRHTDAAIAPRRPQDALRAATADSWPATNTLVPTPASPTQGGGIF